MTTQRDLDRADALAVAFTKLTDEEQAATMQRLALYEDAVEFNDWAAKIGVEPTEEAHARYRDLHYLYLRLWRLLGGKAFFDRLKVAQDQMERERAAVKRLTLRRAR